MKIEKKTWPNAFQRVLDGEKKFEVRLADFECKQGDILILKEWDPDTKEYTGRVIEKEVGFIFNIKDLKYWSEEEIQKYGLYVMTIK